MNNFKYYNFEYSNEVKKLLDYEFNDIEINKIRKMKDTTKYTYLNPIIEDLYILVCKHKLSTSELTKIYDVGVRTIQLWLKELGLNRNLKTASKIKKKRKNKRIDFEKDIKLNVNSGASPNINNLVKEYDYCLYRLLDKDKNVLYIGKCMKTYHQNGREKVKEYFIRERLNQHYSPSSKQNPKSLYLNTRYIEITYPNVSNNEELEVIESSLIVYYERNYLACNYNNNIGNYKEIKNDANVWEEIKHFSDKDIYILLEKYEFDDVPPIEITNERLKAMLYIKNKLKNYDIQRIRCDIYQ